MEGEAELQVGVEHTALHVVDGHLMRDVRVLVIEPRGEAAVSVYVLEYLLFVIRGSCHGSKVDVTGGHRVRAAEVEHELIIDKYPQIVVTGEIELLMSSISVQTVRFQTSCHPRRKRVDAFQRRFVRHAFYNHHVVGVHFGDIIVRSEPLGGAQRFQHTQCASLVDCQNRDARFIALDAQLS